MRPLGSIDLLILALYFGGLVVFGIVVRRVRSFSDFTVGGRAVPAAMVMASLCATYIGPGYTMGLSGRAFSGGWTFPMLFCLFALQTVLSGWFLVPRLQRHSSAHSLGDVMEFHYGSASKIWTGVISVGLCFGLAGVVGKAGGSILATALGTEPVVGILIVSTVGVVYTFTGGLRSVIATEAIQFAIMLAGVGLLLLLTASRAGSFQEASAAGALLTAESLRSLGAAATIGLCTSLLLGEMLIPPYANRALAAGSAKDGRWGFVLAGIFAVVWFGMIGSAGILSRSLLPPNTPEDGVLLGLASMVLPAGLLGLFCVAAASIVMSTQESLLNAGAVALTRDILPKSFAWSDELQLRWSRGATLVGGLLSVLVALYSPGIVRGLLVCYSIWASTVLPPLVLALLGGRVSQRIALASMLGGGAACAGSSLLLGTSAEGIATIHGLIGASVAAALTWGLERLGRWS